MSEKPGPANNKDEAQRELEQLMLDSRMRKIKNKILVLSGKGGVGKSTVSAGLASSLARAGKKVGLLDVDLHGPSIPKMLGLEKERPNSKDDEGIEPIKLGENLKVMSVGFLVNSPADAVIWRGPMKNNVIKQFLSDMNWGDLDYLVIDSPPGTGDEPLSVAQMVGFGAWAVLVTTPQDVAVADVRRSVSFCNTLGLRVAGIIENMSGLICPRCGEKIDLFKVGGGEKLAKQMGVRFLGTVPIDPQIVISGDAGEPYIQSHAQSEAAKSFSAVIQKIQDLTEQSVSEPKSSDSKDGLKIAIPTAEGKLSAHFGHCEKFALVEVDEGKKTIVGVSYLNSPPHEPGVLPRWLHQQGADMIIAGGMGQRALDLFSQQGIQVVLGAATDTPENIVNAYLNGALVSGENVCDH